MFKFLGILFGVGIVLAIIQFLSAALRRWLGHNCPIFAAAILMLCVWEVVTGVLHWLPLPYFPAPGAVLQSMMDDHALLFDSTWHSLLLLLAMRIMGWKSSGLDHRRVHRRTGQRAGMRYWGMLPLKVVGPIPATAWIPLAMVVSPSAIFSAA